MLWHEETVTWLRDITLVSWLIYQPLSRAQELKFSETWAIQGSKLRAFCYMKNGKVWFVPSLGCKFSWDTLFFLYMDMLKTSNAPRAVYVHSRGRSVHTVCWSFSSLVGESWPSGILCPVCRVHILVKRRRAWYSHPKVCCGGPMVRKTPNFVVEALWLKKPWALFWKLCD